jgi:hypothetical protein
MAYTPEIPPREQDLAEYLQRELSRIAAEFTLVAEGREKPIFHVEPLKLRDGMLAYADGTDWNPGAGAGFYERRGGAWVKL